MQDVEELPLVLMQSLYLNIKDRIRVDLDAVVDLDILCKADLVFTLDLHEVIKRACIVRKRL